MTRRTPRDWSQYELPRALARGLKPVDGERYHSNRGGKAGTAMLYSDKYEFWIHYRPNRREKNIPRPFLTFSLGYEQVPASPQNPQGIKLTKTRLRARFSEDELRTEWTRLSAIKRSRLAGKHTQVEEPEEHVPTPLEVFPRKVNDTSTKKAPAKKTAAKKTAAKAPRVKAPVKETIPTRQWPADMPDLRDKPASNGHSSSELTELQYRLWDWAQHHFVEFDFGEPDKIAILEELRTLGARPRTREISVTMIVPDGVGIVDIKNLLSDEKNIQLQAVQQD